MCEVLDKAIDKGRIEGRIEGRNEGRIEGRNEGRIEGRAEGIQAMIESCHELGVSAEAVKEQLMKKFSMTEQEAQQKMDLYWKSIV